MADLLSSASLLVAIIAMLYSLWYPEIQEAINREEPTVKQHRERMARDISVVLRTRAIPLATAILLIALIFAKDAVSLCINSATAYYKFGFYSGIEKYSAVGTALVLVVIFSAFLTVHLTRYCCRLGRKISKLKK